MRKNVTKVSKEELKEMIYCLTNQYLNEMDGKTYRRLETISDYAKSEIQSGRFSRAYPRKIVSNDEIIDRAREMQPDVQNHWLSKYIGQTLKFFGKDRLNLVANILFKFEKITKIDKTRTILIGDVVYNGNQISGDGIIINFEKNKVMYKERGSRYSYTLEVDIRSKQLWEELLDQIKMTFEE